MRSFEGDNISELAARTNGKIDYDLLARKEDPPPPPPGAATHASGKK